MKKSYGDLKRGETQVTGKILVSVLFSIRCSYKLGGWWRVSWLMWRVYPVSHCEYSSYSQHPSGGFPFATLPCHMGWCFPGRHSKTLTYLRLQCGQYCFAVTQVPILWQLGTHCGRRHSQWACEVGETMLLVFTGFRLAPSFLVHASRSRGWRGLAQPLLALVLLPACSGWQPNSPEG